MKSIVIIGKRWFDRINGNTYFSSVGLVDGDVKVTIPFRYGYEDQYKYETFRELEKQGFLTGIEHYPNGSHEMPCRYCERMKINLNAFVSDVSRKKDL